MFTVRTPVVETTHAGSVLLTRQRKIILFGLVSAVVFIGAVVCPAWWILRRHAQAHAAFNAATAAYMMYDVEKARQMFSKMARDYDDLSIGALADLKAAFLIYDEQGDLNEAERLFRRFLKDHPGTLMHLPQTPDNFEYHGELQLVAWYFLGRIAEDHGREEEAYRWFTSITDAGSRNPANYIVSEARAIVARRQRVGAHP